MKAFRFRLKRLLDVRRVEENQSAARLRQTTARLRELDARIASAQREHAEVFRDLADHLGAGGLPPEAPLHAATHAGRIDRAIRQAERERADAEKLVRQAEQELRRRKTARRALEELETRELGGWKDDLRRSENAFLDEVASTRHARGR
jgi:flagellar export protein FliJ